MSAAGWAVVGLALLVVGLVVALLATGKALTAARAARAEAERQRDIAQTAVDELRLRGAEEIEELRRDVAECVADLATNAPARVMGERLRRLLERTKGPTT